MDDIALYRTIGSSEDYAKLQDDIVSHCLGAKHLDLNANKCFFFLLLSRKGIHSIPCPVLMLNGSVRVNSYQYLGVFISADLMWSTHIENICNRTRRLTEILHRQFYQQILFLNCTHPSSRICLHCLGSVPKEEHNSPRRRSEICFKNLHKGLGS